MIGLNIKMPKNCPSCPIVQKTKSGFRCPILSRRDGWSHTISVGAFERMPDCPLIDLSQYEDDRK